MACTLINSIGLLFQKKEINEFETGLFIDYIHKYKTIYIYIF